MQYYLSFYSKRYNSPAYCVYKMYKGGGNLSRKGIQFHSLFDYTFPEGYDRGHLVPAKDFAYSANSLLSTFWYHNIVPQTPKLNRGIWKTYETKIRKLSQKDSLLIICGAGNYKGEIPNVCWKIWYSLTTHKCIGTLFCNQNGKILKFNKKLLFTFDEINNKCKNLVYLH